MSDGSPDHGSGFRHSFRALRHRNFLIFWSSSIVSNTGTWLGNLTVPFVLYQSTGSALWIGYAAIAQSVPSLIVGPWGGALSDRLSRKHLLLVTQSAMALVAVGLFASWEAGLRDPLLILLFVAATAVVSGMNQPTWQSFLNDLVPRDDLRSAIALNSIQVNATRALGPAIAGVLLATVGPGLAFLINALSFVAVIIALFLVRPATRAVPSAPIVRRSVLRDVAGAAAYSFRHPGLRMALVVSMVFSLFASPIYTLTVVLADEVYRVDPVGLGLLNAALGIGGIAFAPFIAGGPRGLRLSRVVGVTLVVGGAAFVALGVTGSYTVALILLLILGAAGLGIVASSQSSLQLVVADAMRGRVISVRLLLIGVMMPLGTQLQSVLADAFGVQVAMVWAGGGLLVAAAVLLMLAPRRGLRRLDDPQDD